MLILILKIIFLQIVISSLNTYDAEFCLLKRFIIEFKDDSNIKKWKNSSNIKSIPTFKLFKGIISKVAEILSVIDTDKYAAEILLIMETKMNVFKLGYPYIVTYNIVGILHRIITIKEIQDKSKLLQYIMLDFSREYDLFYKMLELTIINIGSEYNFEEASDNLMEWAKFDNDTNIKLLIVSENLSYTKHLMKLSNEMIDSILPKDISTPVYVESSSDGFGNSRKCSGKGIYFFTSEKSSMICSKKMLKYRTKCLNEQSNEKQVDIKKYMGKTFICSKHISKLLITLFHYYSEIKGENTAYEIVLKEDNTYQIKWTFSNLLLKETIKIYWLEQEIKDLSKWKTIKILKSIVQKNVKYSTIKTDYTEHEPLETRLILLSCGHQLGYELIDEFLEYIYIKDSNSSRCHICNKRIWIVGSYNAIVYKIKKNRLRLIRETNPFILF